MNSEEHVIDLHQRALGGLWVAIVIFLMYFLGSEEKDIVDRVECKSQYLSVSCLCSARYIKCEKVYTKPNDGFPLVVQNDLILIYTTTEGLPEGRTRRSSIESMPTLIVAIRLLRRASAAMMFVGYSHRLRSGVDGIIGAWKITEKRKSNTRLPIRSIVQPCRFQGHRHHCFRMSRLVIPVEEPLEDPYWTRKVVKRGFP